MGYFPPPSPHPSVNHPSSTNPPIGANTELYRLFRAADTNNCGQLTEVELGRALMNGDWTPFDPRTVKLMISMFDVDRYAPEIESVDPILVQAQLALKNSFDCGDI
jgi:hypothetical protein